jgi:hypothetical protein
MPREPMVRRSWDWRTHPPPITLSPPPPESDCAEEAVIAILADRLGLREDDAKGISTTLGRLPPLPLLEGFGTHEVVGRAGFSEW